LEPPLRKLTKNIFLASLSLGLSLLALVAGCVPETEIAPKDTPSPYPTPLGVTYCDIDPSDVCLEGFGLAGEDYMLILFKADDRNYTNIKLYMTHDQDNSYPVCLQSETFPENVYCQADFVPAGDKIELMIYSARNNTLKATGAFIVQYGSIPEPDVVSEITPEATSKPTSDADYPNPATATVTPEPEYPNSSYSN